MEQGRTLRLWNFRLKMRMAMKAESAKTLWRGTSTRQAAQRYHVAIRGVIRLLVVEIYEPQKESEVIDVCKRREACRRHQLNCKNHLRKG